MKKLFRFFSIALAASTMMFTACSKENNGQDPDQPATPTYTITVESNDATMGTVMGGGVYAEGTTITISATPNEGYKFVKWQDGITEASRQVIVSKDETFTATFESAAPADGINVTFGSDQWSAGYAGIIYYTSFNLMNIIGYQSQSSPYPSIDIFATVETGVHTDQIDANGQMSGTAFYNVDYYAATTLYNPNNGDTLYFGDWWAKTATINTTNFDATAMKVTTVVNATMFDAVAAFIDERGIDAAPTKTLNVTVGNYDLTPAKGAKANMAKAYTNISRK